MTMVTTTSFLALMWMTYLLGFSLSSINIIVSVVKFALHYTIANNLSMRSTATMDTRAVFSFAHAQVETL